MSPVGRFLFGTILLAITLHSSGCASGQATVTAPLLVSLSPSNAIILAGGTQLITATVQNDPSGKGVTWALSPANSGTLTNATNKTVVYTAPSSLTSQLTVTITATSLADSSKVAPATIIVNMASSAISVSLDPPSATMAPGFALGVIATVKDDPTNSGVTWAISPAGAGTLSNSTTASGAANEYSAPASISSASINVTLTATSVADPTKSASTSVTVTTGIIVSVYANGWKQLASTAFIHVSATVDLSALVLNDPANAGVTWNITGCQGDASACGYFTNINNSGLSSSQYVAPPAVPPGGQVIVVATSITDPSKNASLPVTISPINFTSQNYSVGSSPSGITVADLNNDGNLDIVVTDSGNPSSGDPGGLSILLGNSDGTFQPAVSVIAGKNPIYAAVGDFNGDGKQDLVVTELGDRPAGGVGSIDIFIGNGDGTFQSPVILTAGTAPFEIALGDFNGDSKLDFAVTSVTDGVYLVLGNGDGTFETPSLVVTGVKPVTLAAQDLNGDGKLDLAIAVEVNPASPDNGGVRVVLGNGDGTFQPPTFYPISVFPTSITIGDLNGDGKSDLIMSSAVAVFGFESAVLNVLLGNGDGTFASNLPTSTGRSDQQSVFPLSVALASFEPGAKPAVAETRGGSVAILPGNGDGTFQNGLIFANGSAYQLAVADFNGDGKPDLVVTNQSNNTVTIMLNTTSQD